MRYGTTIVIVALLLAILLASVLQLFVFAR